MGKKRKELSHEEIWDDSGLIDSWNQSYEEYKRYHSLHARGENVRDVIAREEAAQAQEVVQNGGTATNGEDVHALENEDDTLEDGEVQDDEAPVQGDTEQRVDNEAMSLTQPPVLQARAQPEAPPEAPSFPGSVAERVQDEGLKNLMMSWYWAGYYTGFYEGQKAPATHAQEGHRSDQAA